MRLETLFPLASVLFVMVGCNETRFTGGSDDRPSAQKSKKSPDENNNNGTKQGTLETKPANPGQYNPGQQNPGQQNPPVIQNPPVTQKPPVIQNPPVTQNPVPTVKPPNPTPYPTQPPTPKPVTPVPSRCTSGNPFTALYTTYGGTSSYSATITPILTYEAHLALDLPLAEGESKACFVTPIPKYGTSAVSEIHVNRAFILNSATAGDALPAGDQTLCRRVNGIVQVGPTSTGKPLWGYAPMPTVSASTLPRVTINGWVVNDPDRTDGFPIVTLEKNVCFAKFGNMTVLLKDNTAQ